MERHNLANPQQYPSLLPGYIIHYKRAAYVIVKTDLRPPTRVLWEGVAAGFNTGKEKAMNKYIEIHST